MMLQEAWLRWLNVRGMAGLLWWAITLPSSRFHARLLGFCRAVVEEAERNER
jgi:hypothetical protein